MSVFPFPSVTPSFSDWTLESNVGAHVSFSGATQTVDRTGERWRAQLSFNNLRDPDARRLMAWAAAMNGQQHRFTLHDHSYSIAGSISASEMLDVAFNATNWSVNTAARGAITDTDSGVRFTVGTDETGDILRVTAGGDGISAPTAARSYAASMSNGDGRLASDGAAAPFTRIDVRDASFSNLLHPSGTALSTSGRQVVGITAPSASTVFPQPSVNTGGAGKYGAAIDIHSLSLARALLIDNGFNALTYSEQFDNAAWTKTRATISSNAAVAPDGSTTADELIEDSTASNTHSALQSYPRASVAEYWTGSVYIKSNTSRRIFLQVHDGVSGSRGEQYFDATTGATTGTAAAQISATNCYSSMHSVGNGWYRCRVSVRLPASTTARLNILLCDGAANTTSFNGDGSSGLYIWGAQLQRGGQLGRYIPTTTTATTGTAQTGKRIWLKGLNASTNGQLLPGDRVEINGQVVMLTSALDGDASGVGLLECSPRVRTSLADETAVVLHKPTGKFLLAGDVSYHRRPGGFTDITIDCVEDIA